MTTKLRLTIDVEYEGDVSKTRLAKQLLYAAGHLSGNGMLSDASSEVKAWDCKVTDAPPEGSTTIHLTPEDRADLDSLLEYVTEGEHRHYEEVCFEQDSDVPSHAYAQATRLQEALERTEACNP